VKDKLSRFRSLIYLHQFVSECMFIYPFYAIMFSERSGLNTAAISALFAWWTFVALISEIPTGILADRFSRKASLIAWNILQASAFGIWIAFPSFYGYALGFTLWGIGYAFGSGAFEAYVYDKLKEMRREDQFTKIFTRTESMYLLGMLAAYLSAIVIGPKYNLLLIISIIGSLIAACIAAFLPSDDRTGRKHTTHINALKSAAREVYNSPILLKLAITAAVTGSFIAVMEEYVPLYYKLVGVSVDNVPVLLAAGLLLGAAVAWMAHRFENRKMLFGLTISGIAGLILVGTSFAGTAVAVLGLLAFMRLISLATLLYDASLQHHIADDMRATVSSIPAFMNEFITIVILAAYGLIANSYGDFAPVRFVGVLAVLAALILALIWKKQRGLRLSKPEGLIAEEGVKRGLTA
jgi:MFS family permease